MSNQIVASTRLDIRVVAELLLYYKGKGVGVTGVSSLLRRIATDFLDVIRLTEEGSERVESLEEAFEIVRGFLPEDTLEREKQKMAAIS